MWPRPRCADGCRLPAACMLPSAAPCPHAHPSCPVPPRTLARRSSSSTARTRGPTCSLCTCATPAATSCRWGGRGWRRFRACTEGQARRLVRQREGGLGRPARRQGGESLLASIDSQAGLPYPTRAGVRCADNGPKQGLLGVDNGQIWRARELPAAACSVACQPCLIGRLLRCKVLYRRPKCSWRRALQPLANPLPAG